MHDGVKKIQGGALYGCESLKSINLVGVRVIGSGAFADCTALEDVDFVHSDPPL
jgi:hypothetical protein